MTLTTPRFNVKSIAIIGAGPSGIASVYDLTRITKQGESLFGQKDISSYEKSGELLYDTVIAFERNSTVGGVWAKSVFHEDSPDPYIPDFDYVGDMSVPQNIYKKFDISEKFEEKLQHSSFEQPVKQKLKKKDNEVIKYQWRGSGAYRNLFTNVTNQFMHFSFAELNPKDLDKINTKYKHIPMHQKAEDVSSYLENVVKENNLKKHIRLNSNVERVRKLPNKKWEVLVSSVQIDNDGSKVINWYKQVFDAIILGSGKTTPFIPHFKGLKDFVETNKNDIDIRLAKSIKDPSYLQSKRKVLFVGSSVSAADLIQYTFPRNLNNTSIFLSRNSATCAVGWVNSCLYSKGINNKPTIASFLPAENAVQFTDGTIESNFDAIIFATGYQTIYPYLEDEFVNAHPDLLNFYLYTFSLADDTLALVGNTYTSFFFNRVESQASALGSVWGNIKELPSLEKQKAWFAEKQPLITPLVKPNFIDPLMELSIEDRPHPFSVNKNKSDHTLITAEGQQHVLSLWIKIRNGEIDPADALELS